jgi:CubicO group peptidase (beta-lactamase class C family)
LFAKTHRPATGQRTDSPPAEKHCTPLGITNYYWKLTPTREVDPEGGLELSAHDLAKIGYLMLHKGKWENQQIVSKQWVEKSVKPFVTFSEQSGYGYQWWVPKYAEDKAEIFAGNGYGGQFLLVVPEYDMIVVFNGWNIHEQTEKSTWRALQDRILPATRL